MTPGVYSKLLQHNVNYLKNVQWFKSQYTLKNRDLNFKPENLAVLFKSKHFIIVNKPYDLLMYNYGQMVTKEPTLYNYLREKFPFYYDPRLLGDFMFCID